MSWTAAECGVEIDYRMLPFPPRKWCPEYLAENPLGTVPLLVDGEVRLTESTAICHYIAAKSGNPSMLVEPGEDDYGVFLDYLHHADSTLTFPQAVYLRFSIFEKHRGLTEAGEAYARWFGARLLKVQSRLEGRAYLCADRFTIADIVICYSLWLARMLRLDKYFSENVSLYLDRQLKRPGFIQALDRERTAGRGISPTVSEAIGVMLADRLAHRVWD